MREMKKKRILTVMLAAAVIITMCFAGDQLTANASTAGQIKAATVSFTLNESGHNVTVHWKTVKGASGYQIANDATPNKHMKIQWTGRNGNNKYTSVRKTAGRTYRYKMRCFIVQNGVRVYSKWSSTKSILFTAGNKPGTPKITKASSTKTSVTLTWSKAKKADGYRVYKYNGKKYVKIKTLKARTYTVKSLKADTTYKFKVRAYNNAKGKTYYSDMSKMKSIVTKKSVVTPVVVPVKASVSDVTVDSGSTATFKVTVTAGTKPYSYQWYKGGTAIAGATSAVYTTGKLSTSDSGTKYTCRVTNPAGYIEATGTLAVNKVTMPLSVSVADQSAATGSAATFSAAASNGSGNYTYQWYQKSIENTEFVKISNATSSTYSPQTGTTGKVTMHNNGTEYKCVVTDSSSNTASATGNLTVTGATKVGSWNIGAANGTTDYNGSNGTSGVVATLYSDGELAVTGTGNTVVFDFPGYAGGAPWVAATYKTQVKSSTIASTVKPTDMAHWYNGCSNLTTAPSIPASVTKMQATFAGCTSLTKAPDLTGCTSLTYMSATFSGCTSLTDMSGYIIPASVKEMGQTFQDCIKLTKAPAMPSGVEHMLFTFEGCTALTTAPDMTKCTSVTDMMFAFKGCTALLAAPDITKCTSLTNMDFTFKGCTALATGPSMIPASVTKMDYTFLDCKALKGTMQINASPSYYDYVFDGASTNAGTDLKVYSNDATNESTVQAIVNDTKTTSSSSNITYGGYKVKSWNIGSDTAGNYYTGSNGTDKVVATLYSVGELAVTGTGDTVVFYSPVAPWCEDTYKAQVKSSTIASTVKPTNMQFWYNGCSNLTAAPAIPDSVTVMPYTFNNCTSLTKAPDLTGCTSLKSMFATFYGCTSLMDMSSYIIPAGVKDMTLTFKGCTSLTKAPAIPSGMENMSNTFLGCTALLAAPDITKCTSLTNMNSTFNECTALATGPSVIPASVTNMYDAFYDCKSLTGTMQINASPTDYNGCFNYASTNTGTLLKVNYTSGNASIIDFIIQTGTKYGSHIERGVQN